MCVCELCGGKPGLLRCPACDERDSRELPPFPAIDPEDVRMAEERDAAAGANGVPADELFARLLAGCDERCPQCHGDPAAAGGPCPACGALPVVEVWEDDGDGEAAGLGGYDLGGEG